MKTIANFDYAHIKHHEDEKIVEVQWKKGDKNMTIEEYQNTLTLALDFQQNNPGLVLYYLSDIREQRILSPNYRKWFQEVALPRALENKLEAGAVIFDGNVFKKYYLNNIMNSTKKFGMPFKFFSKKEDALDWFKSL